jgi:hypothetical protein
MNSSTLAAKFVDGAEHTTNMNRMVPRQDGVLDVVVLYVGDTLIKRLPQI